MENNIIVLITSFVMIFIVNLINGNMIGRHDGVRANCNCMVFLSQPITWLLFFSRRKKYNIWSCLAQTLTLLYFCFSIVLQILNENIILYHFKLILVSFIVIHVIFYACLFIDIMIYDYKYRNRF